MQTFGFRFTPLYRASALPFGITRGSARVDVADKRLLVRFGPWVVDTPLTNVAGTETTGPYSIFKTIGPPHLSLADGGLTFATNRDRGLCIHFSNSVPGVEPFRRVRHGALTVTVEDIEGLAATLSA